ncbi:MAG TPA: hypothetical protein VM100_01050 [Longimicrobiales bacterium]|nr:hypothetical protein [Longimicrobiales bacterium]
MRGPKTHRADIMQNRGEHREPENPETDRMEASENELSRADRQVKDEHPTGRMTEGGYRAQHGNRV